MNWQVFVIVVVNTVFAYLAGFLAGRSYELIQQMKRKLND